MDHSELIINRLYMYLDQKNITLNKLATLTNIRQSTLNNMVSNKSVPKVDTLFIICEALDISIFEFLDFPPYNTKKVTVK